MSNELIGRLSVSVQLIVSEESCLGGVECSRRVLVATSEGSKSLGYPVKLRMEERRERRKA